MNNLIKAVWHQDGMISVDNLFGSAFTSEDGGHTFQIRGVDESGEPLSLGGTITATFIRPDGTTVALNGTNPDGVATVTLTDDCYAVPGYFGMTIFMTLSGQTTCIYACAGNIVSSSTGSVAPTDSVDVVDLINAIAEAVASIPADYSGLWATLAPEYSTSATYGRGSIVRYNQKIYRNTTEITTPESWTSSHWTEDTLGGALNSIFFKYIAAVTEANDCDNLTQSGYVYWTNTHAPAHAPSSNAYMMLTFRRTSTSITQLAIPMVVSANARLSMRFNVSGTWSSWYKMPTTNDMDAAIAEVESLLAVLESNLYSDYTDFENGNINSSGQGSNANKHPLRSGYIYIDEFVSVDVTGDDGAGNNYTYQVFAYDSGLSYLGYGNTTRHTEVTTREDILTAYPTTKYIRIKITGGNPDVDLDPDDLADYGYTGLVCMSYDSVKRAASGDVDIMSMIEANADENGKYSSSFTLEFDLSNAPKILSISAQYTGDDAPTIQISNRSTGNNTTLPSPVYLLGGTVEMTRKSWRIPPASSVYTRGRIAFTIPSGTIVDIKSAQIRDDQRSRYGTSGITFHGHAGSIAPSNTVPAFQMGAELGYDSMITIPKIMSDGTGVCFHDDSKISGDLCWMDGTSITGSDDKAISDYTYEYITQNFRIKSVGWGILHVPKIEDFIRICSLTGMKPFFSVHSSPSGMWTGTTGQANFQKIKDIAIKWNILNKIGIKSGSDSIQAAARAVFGTDIDSYILLSGQTHAPYNQLTLAKNAGFVDSSATDLTGCPYNLIAEYFYQQTVPTATYYTETMASIATEKARGFKISIAITGTNAPGEDIKNLIAAGVTEFTVDNHISTGLDW